MQERSEAPAQAQAEIQVLARDGNDTDVALVYAQICTGAFPMEKNL